MNFERAFTRCSEFPHACETVNEKLTDEQIARVINAGLIVDGNWIKGADWALPFSPRPRKPYWGSLNGGGMGHSAV